MTRDWVFVLQILDEDDSGAISNQEMMIGERTAATRLSCNVAVDSDVKVSIVCQCSLQLGPGPWGFPFSPVTQKGGVLGCFSGIGVIAEAPCFQEDGVTWGGVTAGFGKIEVTPRIRMSSDDVQAMKQHSLGQGEHEEVRVRCSRLHRQTCVQKQDQARSIIHTMQPKHDVRH